MNQNNNQTDFHDSEFSILSVISEASTEGSRLTQRDLADKAGISLGMVNILLKRLAEKGWVKLTRLSSKSLRYALTSEGMGELAARTANYFSRVSRSADLYRERLEAFVIGVKRAGVGTIVLYGSSEVELVLSYVCERHGLVFVKSADLERARALALRRGAVLLFAESESGAGQEALVPPASSLAAVLAGFSGPQPVAADPIA